MKAQRKEILEILSQCKDYLSFRKAMGLGFLPASSGKVLYETVMLEGSSKGNENNPPVSSVIIPPSPPLKKEGMGGLTGISPIGGRGSEENIGQEKRPTLADVRRELGDCERCKLHKTRTNIVFGAGNEQAKLVFVGEGPGLDEDIQGEPFVGAAGQLLTRIIRAINLRREDVYICNIIKCRPPKNRNPEPDEIEACKPFVLKQLEVIRPRLICALGSVAAQALLETAAPIGILRGRFHSFRGVKLMPTYHPAYLLRNPAKKREVWEDMQMIQKEYQAL
ncbi:MAG: uracil-DNA glycosylase [Thermodesulfobacteriota bacterium]|nr:uracil-DNA glycosylase [Thermodesulfobacteriota bacterium]